MADLNSTIVRGKLRVTDEIVGPLNVVNLSIGSNGQFLSISNNVPKWVNNPIQDNLTSTSTTESLSANQGKVLKDLVDGKVNSSDLVELTLTNNGTKRYLIGSYSATS